MPINTANHLDHLYGILYDHVWETGHRNFYNQFWPTSGAQGIGCNECDGRDERGELAFRVYLSQRAMEEIKKMPPGKMLEWANSIVMDRQKPQPTPEPAPTNTWQRLLADPED